jgi:hypothetical protein
MTGRAAKPSGARASYLPSVKLRAAAALLALVLAGCAGGTAAFPRSDPSVAPLSPPPGATGGGTEVVSVGDCPVDDRRFCPEASALANAITQRNSDAVFTLSRPSRFVCSEVDPSTFPQCEGRDALEGFVVADYQGHRFVDPEERYRRNLRFFVEAIDEEYSDELGGPEPRIVGVSMCADGGEPSYHLVYTVGLGDPQSTFPGTRFLGTYELTQLDREWAVTVAHFGLFTDWELVLDEPLSQIGCGGILPWGA